MIIVSVAFVICWSPQMIYPTVLNFIGKTTYVVYAGYYATVFLSHLYICMNPFIYAFKHEAVKKKLARLIMCHKRVEVNAVAEAPGINDNRRDDVVGTQQPQTVPTGQ